MHKTLFTFAFVLLFSLAIDAQIRSVLTWEVVKYDLTATLPQNYAADRDLDVKATLKVKNIKTRSYSKLTMRVSDQAKVSAVQVNGTAADFSNGEEKIGGDRKLQRIIVRLPTISTGGTVSVTVNYKLNVKANSGLNALSPVGSQFLPLSHWYPTPTSWYFTGGGDHAPFTLKVNSANGLSVVSSGKRTANGFEQNLNGQPFFTVGNWDLTNSNGVEVLIPKGMDANPAIAKELGSVASEMKTFVIDQLGKSFDTTIRIVGVSRGSGFADSGTIFVDESVFRRQKLDSRTAMTVSESVAKVWLGSLVKVEGDGYGVIREGLSRYLSTQFIEKRYGKDVANLERLRQRTKYAAISLRDAPLNVVSPIDGYYYTASANKGAMIWKFLAKAFGNEFFSLIRTQAEDGILSLAELRSVFSTQKAYLDNAIDNVTKLNLMIGLPRKVGSQTKVALRNFGEIDVDVDVTATTSTGQKIVSRTNIKAKSFGEGVFNTTAKIDRVEIDADKIYPQTDYSDDIAPKVIAENDPLVFIKREFDRQKFSAAEKNAEAVLKVYPIFDDARILLARSQLAQGKVSDAEKNFRLVIAVRLPSSQSLAWASYGLGEIAKISGRNAEAKTHFDEAIAADSELSAVLSARRARNKIGIVGRRDPGVKAFFVSFDKVVSANNKSGIDSMVVNGEVARFAGRVAGQAQEWKTEVLHVDRIDANNILVEATMSVKLLNRGNENGLAVYRLSKVGNGWKLSGVEVFEIS